MSYGNASRRWGQRTSPKEQFLCCALTLMHAVTSIYSAGWLGQQGSTTKSILTAVSICWRSKSEAVIFNQIIQILGITSIKWRKRSRSFLSIAHYSLFSFVFTRVCQHSTQAQTKAPKSECHINAPLKSWMKNINILAHVTSLSQEGHLLITKTVSALPELHLTSCFMQVHMSLFRWPSNTKKSHKFTANFDIPPTETIGKVETTLIYHMYHGSPKPMPHKYSNPMSNQLTLHLMGTFLDHICLNRASGLTKLSGGPFLVMKSPAKTEKEKKDSFSQWIKSRKQTYYLQKNRDRNIAVYNWTSSETLLPHISCACHTMPLTQNPTSWMIAKNISTGHIL